MAKLAKNILAPVADSGTPATVNITGSNNVTLNGVDVQNDLNIRADDDSDTVGATLTLNTGAITTSAGAITLQAGSDIDDTIDVNQNVTAATTLDINNAGTVDIASGLTISTTNGALNAFDNVTDINLSGAGLVTIDGNGDALVRLANLTDSGAQNLTVTSEGDLTLDGADLDGTGTHSFTADSNGGGTNTLTINDLDGTFTVGTATFGGNGTDEIIDVNVDVTSSGAMIFQNAATVDLAGDADLTAGGNLSAGTANNITTVQLSGASDTQNNIEANNDGSVDLANVTSTANAALLITAEANVNVETINTGTGNVTITADDDEGTTADVATLTIGDGTDVFDTAGDVTLTVGANDTIIFDGTTTNLTSLTINGTAATSTVQLGGTITSSAGQNYALPLLLTNNATFVDTGSSDIIYQSTIDSAAVNNFTLNANTTGTTLFGGAVGSNAIAGADADGLGSVTTNATGNTIINGASITTTTAQTFHDAVTVDSTGGTTTLTGTNIVFNSTLDDGDLVNSVADETLTIVDDGATEFNDQVGVTNALGTVNISGGGIVHFDAAGGRFVTVNLWNVDNRVLLDQDTTLESATVDMALAIDSEGAEANDLTVNATTTNFGGNIGNQGVAGSTAALGAITTDALGITTFGDAVLIVTTVGTEDQLFNDAVVLNNETSQTTFTANDITFESTINSLLSSTP